MGSANAMDPTMKSALKELESRARGTDKGRTKPESSGAKPSKNQQQIPGGSSKNKQTPLNPASADHPIIIPHRRTEQGGALLTSRANSTNLAGHQRTDFGKSLFQKGLNSIQAQYLGGGNTGLLGGGNTSLSVQQVQTAPSKTQQQILELASENSVQKNWGMKDDGSQAVGSRDVYDSAYQSAYAEIGRVLTYQIQQSTQDLEAAKEKYRTVIEKSKTLRGDAERIKVKAQTLESEVGTLRADRSKSTRLNSSH